MISTPIDEFFSKFGKDIILIGARQLYSPGHTISRLIHPAFMILQLSGSKSFLVMLFFTTTPLA
jgi:hypothetical protein